MISSHKLTALCLAASLVTACQQENAGNGAAGANQALAVKQDSASGGRGGAQPARTIAQSAAQSADHARFTEAVEAAGMTEVLRGAGPYTVFAPVNAGFEAIPAEARSSLMQPEQRRRLIALLGYHIVPGTVTVQDLARAAERGPEGRAELATMAGGNLSIARNGEAVVITDGAGGTARIVRPDQVSSNGVLHSIDAVLMPPVPERGS